MLSLIQKMIGKFNEEKLPEQYYNMNLTAPQVKIYGYSSSTGLRYKRYGC